MEAEGEVDMFRDSEVGIFLREQAIRFESMRVEGLVNLLDQTKQYVEEKPMDAKESTGAGLSAKAVEVQLNEALARFNVVDSDLVMAFETTLDNATGSNPSQCAKFHFARYLDQLLAGDYEASLSCLDGFFETSFVLNPEFHPFAAFNFGMVNYLFCRYEHAADYFVEMVQLAAKADLQVGVNLALYWIAKLSCRIDAPKVRAKFQRVLGSNYYMQLLQHLSNQPSPYADACRSMLKHERLLQGHSSPSSDPHELLEHCGNPALAFASNPTETQDEHTLILAERLLDIGRVEASENLLHLIKSTKLSYQFSMVTPPWTSLELRLQFEKELAQKQLCKAQITVAHLEDLLLEHRLLRPIITIYRARLLSAQSNPSMAISVLQGALSDRALLSYHRLLLNLALYELYMLRGSFTQAIPIAYAALELCDTGSYYDVWPTAALALADAMVASPDGFIPQAQRLLNEIEEHVPKSHPWYRLICGKLALALSSCSNDVQERKAHLETALKSLQDAVVGYRDMKLDPKLQVAQFLLQAAKKLNASLKI